MGVREIRTDYGVRSMEKEFNLKPKNRTAADVISSIIFRVLWVILIIYAVSMLVLPLYMLNTSLKADDLECVYNPFGLPKVFT